MKLFIAINFKKKIQYKIQDVIFDVKKSSRKGRFVSKEHMHMTLQYFGEVSEEKVNDIVKIMDEIDTRGFTLKIDRLDSFKRDTGNIYWLGVEENRRLFDLQSYLHNRLLDKGFELENRSFVPHITIGRQVVLRDSFKVEEYIAAINKIRIKVRSIELMKSEEIKGKLTYTQIYSKKL